MWANRVLLLTMEGVCVEALLLGAACMHMLPLPSLATQCIPAATAAANLLLQSLCVCMWRHPHPAIAAPSVLLRDACAYQEHPLPSLARMPVLAPLVCGCAPLPVACALCWLNGKLHHGFPCAVLKPQAAPAAVLRAGV